MKERRLRALRQRVGGSGLGLVGEGIPKASRECGRRQQHGQEGQRGPDAGRVRVDHEASRGGHRGDDDGMFLSAHHATPTGKTERTEREVRGPVTQSSATIAAHGRHARQGDEPVGEIARPPSARSGSRRHVVLPNPIDVVLGDSGGWLEAFPDSLVA